MHNGLLQERRERHRQNYMHVTIHTSQTWADTFISELNDTHVEAELRTKHIPPQVRHSTISARAVIKATSPDIRAECIQHVSSPSCSVADHMHAFGMI